MGSQEKTQPLEYGMWPIFKLVTFEVFEKFPHYDWYRYMCMHIDIAYRLYFCLNVYNLEKSTDDHYY